MYKDIKELADELYAIVQSKAGTKEQPEWFKKNSTTALKRFNIPRDISADILNGSKRVDNDFIGFLFTKLLAPELIDKYFTPSEVAMYDKAKYTVDVITDVRLQMVKVADDQWIGATSLKYLLRLEEHHMLRYNENTQRILRRRIDSNGEVRYEPYLNPAAVTQITGLLENRTYIPNTITLNVINPDLITYNDGTLVISGFKKDEPVFDILDGYHRFRAMKRIHLKDGTFDYPMELRIVAYAEERAKQFIWQEDQKTKMKRIDSRSFNQDRPSNRIVAELNDVAPFRGLLTANSKVFDVPFLSELISCAFFKRGEVADRAKQLNVKKRLVTTALIMEEQDPSMFERRWTNAEMAAMVVTARQLPAGQKYSTYQRLLAYAVELGLYATGTETKRETAKLINKAEKEGQDV